MTNHLERTDVLGDYMFADLLVRTGCTQLDGVRPYAKLGEANDEPKEGKGKRGMAQHGLYVTGQRSIEVSFEPAPKV